MNDNTYALTVLNLPANDLVLKELIRNVDGTVLVTIEKKPAPVYCEECGTRMHSKGIYQRSVNHPVLNGPYAGHVLLKVRQHKWKCPACQHFSSDSFQFLEKGKQSTDIVPLMILKELKDPNVTCRQAADRLHVSDTYVHVTFMRYVNLQRLPLSSIISIDEVYLDIDHQRRYAMVIMDFIRNEVIDILPGRGKEVTDAYFASISREEKDQVQFVVSDMYKPYIAYAGTVFRHAKAVVDSFHVISWLLNKMNLYINGVKKRYQEIDARKLQEKNYTTNRDHKTIRDSREVTLLKKYRWILLKNNDNIEYSEQYRHMRGMGGAYLNTWQLEKMFMDLDSHFPEMRRLKEMYISFNRTHINDLEGAARDLDILISEYRSSSVYLFHEFADTLSQYRTEIIASFTYISMDSVKIEADTISTLKRISNGPMEGFNNIPKDMKRAAGGVSNFEFIRNRILWATRKDAHMLGVPRSEKEVHTYTNKKRGPYRKKTDTNSSE